MSGVVAPGIVEQLVGLRRRAPSGLWKEVCRVLSAASDEQTVDELLGKLHPSVNPDLYSALRSLLYACRRDASWQSLGFALELAGQVVEQQDRASQVELIWTGPPAPLHLRRLEQVLYDLIHEAQSRILLVTFAASHIRHLNEALFAAIARNVKVRLVLEFKQTSEGQLSFDALRAFEP